MLDLLLLLPQLLHMVWVWRRRHESRRMVEMREGEIGRWWHWKISMHLMDERKIVETELRRAMLDYNDNEKLDKLPSNHHKYEQLKILLENKISTNTQRRPDEPWTDFTARSKRMHDKVDVWKSELTQVTTVLL